MRGRCGGGAGTLVAALVCAAFTGPHPARAQSPAGAAPGGGARPSLALEAPAVIAHRGASGYAPEHTFPAWDLALEMGADYLEQDLQMTADGRLVVLHDASLERTGRGPGCHGEVADLTLAAVRRCDVGRWYGGRWADADVRIPTLAEVLDRYRGRARFHIETKRPDQAPGMEEALVEMLGRAGLLPADPGDPTVLIQSFSPESLRRVAALAPALPRVQLLTRDALDAGADAVMARVAGYAHGVGPAASLVDAAFMEAARRHGLLVHPWTVNEPEEMRRLLDLGVHGIFTDVPDVLRRIVDVAGR